ncbi:MAG: alpha/beta hydrolase [Alphaproteobacteria bacterium]|nr:alpha/beta hydrolase [Alphaproteobacteria bacterium]
MTIISINGLDLYYETTGHGSPLLMIAGLASDSQSWAPVVPLLSPVHTLILPDNRAVGRTRPEDAPTSIDLMAGDCVTLLDALELDRISVLGHSMGAMVAMRIAALWPDRVHKLIITASGPEHSARRNSLIDTLVSLGEAGVSDELWFKSLFHWLFAPNLFDDPAQVQSAIELSANYPHRQSIEAMRRQVDAIARFEAGDTAQRITAPTLAILGGRDLLFPLQEATEALAPIRGVKIETLPDAAHSLHWDDPEGFAGHVRTFLDSH